jgi:hypothetical protein
MFYEQLTLIPVLIEYFKIHLSFIFMKCSITKKLRL